MQQRTAVLAMLVSVCSITLCMAACNRQGYQCEADDSLNCRCWNERVCRRASTEEELSAASLDSEQLEDENVQTRKSWSSGKSWGSGANSCHNRQRCAENFRQICPNGCKSSTGQCIDDTEVCGTEWAGGFSSGFCGATGVLPAGYLSWKNHMADDRTSCVNIPGESCANLGARNDAEWFLRNAQAFPVSKIQCDPNGGNQTWCMNGSIPESLQSAAAFFSSSTLSTFELTGTTLESGQSASVTLTPSDCEAAWNSFSCQRNFPECRQDQPESAQCYDVCETVSQCLDAYLFHCMNLSATVGGGNCDAFDWSTAAAGATCDPGFTCEGIQSDSALAAAELRNCRNSVELCEDRPYMLDGGYCQAGELLPNLCEQFQQTPSAESAAASLVLNVFLVVFAAAAGTLGAAA